MDKRSAEDDEVQVIGFGRSWPFVHGVTAGEVVDFAAARYNRRSNDIAIEDRTRSAAGPILGRQAVLAMGRKYFFTDVPDTNPQRSFAVGNYADPRKHYFVPPEHVAQYVDKLSRGQYCVLYGARQSGKTTMAMAIKEQLSMDPQTCVVYLDKVTIDGSWDKNRFWGTVWEHLHGKCSFLFPAKPPGVECTDWSFRSLFLKDNLPLKVTLFVDEGDAFLNASPECLEDLFSTLKSMKEDPQAYNLNGVLLIGVETIKDLLEGQYRTGREAAARSTFPRFSPFSHSLLRQTSRFEVEDVVNLLRQAESERPGVIIQIERVAVSVMDWTGGHKGMVGSCLDHLVNKELWSYRQWVEEAESFRLAAYLFQQQTYSRILSACRAHIQLLESFLGVEARRCDDVNLRDLRGLLAEGVLFAKEARPEGFEVRISSPLLRAVILRRCIVTSETVELPPQAYHVDPLWTILEAIKSLDLKTMCRPECDEFSYRFALFARLKAVLRQAYPSIYAQVLCCEAKQGVDIVVRNNNDNFWNFGCELVVNADNVEGRTEKAVSYAKEHSAQVYVINFTMQEEPQMVTPDHASVIFISVQVINPIGPGSQATRARVSISEVGGGNPTEMDLELRKWDGKISFDRI